MPEMDGVSALGQGPQSPAVGLSDRAGEESALRPAEPSISPTTQVLRTLDMMDGPPDPTLRSAVGEGEDLAARPPPTAPDRGRSGASRSSTAPR